jgi:hypothetical protein
MSFGLNSFEDTFGGGGGGGRVNVVGIKYIAECAGRGRLLLGVEYIGGSGATDPSSLGVEYNDGSRNGGGRLL